MPGPSPTTSKRSDQMEERLEIAELFPNLDLSEVFLEYSHLSSEALIDLILAKRDQIPTKTGMCARFVIKACSFATDLAGRWPRWLGGRLFGRVVSAIETNVTSVVDPNKNGGRARGSLSTVRECMECSVCWEAATMEQLCFCDAMANITNGANNSDNTFGTHRRPSDMHAFCRTCLEGHAHAALEEMPLAKGGLGLRCMVSDCDNPITFQEIRTFISDDLSSKLEERCAEISITQAGLSYMERCRSCNCAVEVGAAPLVMQVFHCPECKQKFCRLCDEQWHPEHQGVSCDDYAKQQNRERLLEKRLNEAVVHKCPKCKLAFVKHDGCNKVTCRCGATQCYICRQNNVDYSHFCRCFHEKRHLGGPFKCSKCEKICLLWESSAPIEKRAMERVRQEVKEEEERKAKRAAERAKRARGAAGPSGSNSNSTTALNAAGGKKLKKEEALNPPPKQQSRTPLKYLGHLLNR